MQKLNEIPTLEQWLDGVPIYYTQQGHTYQAVADVRSFSVHLYRGIQSISTRRVARPYRTLQFHTLSALHIAYTMLAGALA